MNGMYEDQIPQELDAETGLLIGPLMDNPGPSKSPERTVLDGRYCRLEPLDPDRHSEELYAASTPDDAQSRFMYLGEEVPVSVDDLDAEHARFEAEGLAPRKLVEFAPDGKLVGRFFFVADPDGYEIEVLERSGRFK